jgi:hypothetical protein
VQVSAAGTCTVCSQPDPCRRSPAQPVPSFQNPTYGTLFIRGFFFEDRVTEAYDKPRRKNSRSLRRKIVTAAMPSPQLHSYLERGWQLESAVMCSWHGNLYILMRSETKTTGQFQYHRALAKPPNQRKKQQNSPPELHAHSAVRVSLSWKACNQVKS